MGGEYGRLPAARKRFLRVLLSLEASGTLAVEVKDELDVLGRGVGPMAGMIDTPPHIAAMVRERLMARSGEERMEMAARSFVVAREIILASLAADLTPEERRRALYERVYGAPAPWAK